MTKIGAGSTDMSPPSVKSHSCQSHFIWEKRSSRVKWKLAPAWLRADLQRDLERKKMLRQVGKGGEAKKGGESPPPRRKQWLLKRCRRLPIRSRQKSPVSC